MPLPNFSEALSKFRSLRCLSLTSLNFSKINESIFIEFLKNAPSLSSLHLDSVEGSNQFANILKAFRLSETLIDLKLANIPIQNSAYRLEKLADFVVNAYKMHKCVLESNKLAYAALEAESLAIKGDFDKYVKKLQQIEHSIHS